MTSSWKRPASRRLFSLLLAAGLFGIAVLSPLRPAAAAATCAVGVPEAGGSHRRCTSSNGVFHVWTPAGYDAARPSYVVVYAHGWSDQCGKPSPQDSTDGVPDTWFNTPGAVYIDAAWSSHGLANQFAGSGMANALFVAPQVPTCGPTTTALDPAHVDRTLRWSNFDDLLVDLGAAGIGAFNAPIVLMGHSGAYASLKDWENDNSKINHVIHLDTFYGSVSSSPVSDFKAWLKNAAHTSSLIATSETNSQTSNVVGGLTGAKTLPTIPASLGSMDEASQKARVLYIASNVTHMQIVTQGRVIPMLLQRVSLAGAKMTEAPAPAAPTTPTGSPSTKPSPTETRPVLEIPVPGVEFSGIIRENGEITVPWLAQYIGGVYTFLLSIVGLVAAVVMVVGGFQYLTSGGDAARVSKGREKIVNALTGLVLAFGSYTILYIINPGLVSFEGLKIMDVQTERFGEYAEGANVPPLAELGNPQAPPPPPSPPAPAPGSNQRTCSNTKDCLPFCRAAECKTVLCYKGDVNCPPANLPGFEGVTLKAVGAPTQSDCIQNKLPEIPPGAPVRAITWPGIHNIIPNGQKASQLVIEGLQRAEKYIDDNYAGQDLKISLSNCYRDTRLDFAWQCTEIMRPPPSNNPVNFGSTWPGSNPHSSGYACDLSLTKGGKNNTISGHMSNQSCTSKGAGNKLLLDILTNTTVAGRRLGYEAWHFNWGGFNSCYCALDQCPTFPKIGDCKGNHENTKC